MTKTMMIFGMGFTGKVLARVLLAAGWSVRGTSRSGDIGIDGAAGYAFAGTEAIADPKAFDGITHVLSTIPVVDGHDPVLAHHGTRLAAAQVWAGYVSATSVYTESDGDWVTEDSPTKPSSRRGQYRRQAEIEWQDKLGAEVFRAAGIYGTGRSPFKKLLAGQGRIISKPGHQFNRVHVDDIAQVIVAAMAKPCAGRVLNLADGAPCESGDVVRFAAGLLGVDPPEPIAFEDAEMTPMARSFYGTSRRVDSSRIKAELGVDLIHADYKSGLTAALAEEYRLGLLPRKIAAKG
jgi:nucleoside-diphosphate-sugar epimerase